MKRFLGKLVLAFLEIFLIVAISPVLIIMLILAPIYALVEWSIKESRK